MMTTLGPTVLVDGQSYTSVNGRVYLPDLRNSNSWLSEFYVRNNGTEHRDVSIYYFLPNGLPTPKVSDVCSLYPNQWCWIPVSDLNRVPVGATASAFVDGGEDVSIVVVNRGGAPGYAFTGQYVLSTTMFLPETIDLNAWQMRFPVFNAGSAVTNITTQFFDSNGGPRTPQIANGIASKGQSSEFPLSDIDPNNNYTGAGRVSASQSIAVVAQVFDNTSRRLGYSGTSTADTTVWLPFVMTRLNNGWGTTLWVQNTTGTSSWVEVDFCQEGAPGCYPTTGQVTLSANGMTSFNLRINDYGLGWG